jgi:L-serine dehydratase
VREQPGVADVFKIGVGPSSSHTMGPMLIARRFLEEAHAAGVFDQIAHVGVSLYGSLAATGRGHSTDRAIFLGLSGLEPATLDAGEAEAVIRELRENSRISLLGAKTIPFDVELDLEFRTDIALPLHPNGVRLAAYDEGGDTLTTQTYYSVGGGTIRREDEMGAAAAATSAAAPSPFPFRHASELLAIGKRENLTIAQIMLANEDAVRPRAETEALLARLWATMADCIERGLTTKETVLPGSLKLRRRAPKMHADLVKRGAQGANEPETLMDWLNLYAMAVNEENAAGGRVVTAPTNGAAGIIPAVIRRYGADDPKLVARFLLTAAAIGSLYKTNASISGAEMGCQGEVGVACSMAAAGLAAVWGGTNAQIEHAAEIGMEHNLGLTCDPVAGLVQIPCIERNAIGAVKAVNAARLAMSSTGDHKVSLDQVIETMRQTGLDMSTRYKETSEGGLAVNVVEC